MKAFALANAQGQKIYTITKANIAEVLPKMQASSLVKGDIASSVAVGQIVTVHEREVSVPGWRGTGYMAIDPVNSNGAFLIGGGGNGGFAEIDERLKQPIYAIYWGFTHLDEVGALFFASAIGKIVSTLDNILDVFDTTYKCGGILGLVSALMAGMISIIAAYPLMIIYLLPIFAVLKYILIASIMYGAALAFNNINGNIQEHCKK